MLLILFMEDASCGSCVLWESRCVVVAVCGSRRVLELRGVGAAVCGIHSVWGLKYGQVLVRGVAVWVGCSTWEFGSKVVAVCGSCRVVAAV